MRFWPSQELQLRLRDECFDELVRLPQARVLELAPELGAFQIPRLSRTAKNGLWTLTIAPWGWRAGPDEVYVIVGAQVDWLMLPFRYTCQDRGFGFNNEGRPVELAPHDIDRLIP